MSKEKPGHKIKRRDWIPFNLSYHSRSGKAFLEEGTKVAVTKYFPRDALVTTYQGYWYIGTMFLIKEGLEKLINF